VGDAGGNTLTQSPDAPAEETPDHEADVAKGRTNVITHPLGNPAGMPLARVSRARGGVSVWSVISGALVAFGAFAILSGIVGALLTATGQAEAGLVVGDITAAGVAVFAVLVIIQFLAYFWGGYAAGRMARGSGLANGGLVAVTGIAILLVLALVWTQAGGTTINSAVAPVGEWSNLASGAGIVLLLAMLLGGAFGGRMGARWHNKLENAQLPGAVR